MTGNTEVKRWHETFLKLLDFEDREELHIHQVCVTGDTSCGKSTLINFLLGYDLNHVGVGVATRRPLELNVKDGTGGTTTFSLTFTRDQRYVRGKDFTKIKDLHDAIRELNDKTMNPELFPTGEFDKEPIILDVILGAGDHDLKSSVGSNVLRLVDLPGTTSHNQEPLEIAKTYMKSQNSMIVIIGVDESHNAQFPKLLEMSSSHCRQTFVIQNFTHQLLDLGKVKANWEMVQSHLADPKAIIHYVDPGNRHGATGRKTEQENWEQIAAEHGDLEVRRRMREYETQRAEGLRNDFAKQRIDLQRTSFGTKPVVDAIVKTLEQSIEKEVDSMAIRIEEQIQAGELEIKELSDTLDEKRNSSDWESFLESCCTFFLKACSGERMDELRKKTEEELSQCVREDGVQAVWIDVETDSRFRMCLSNLAQQQNKPDFDVPHSLKGAHRRLNQELNAALCFAAMKPISKEDLRNAMYQIGHGLGDRLHPFDVVVDLVYRHGGIRVGDCLKTYRRRLESMFKCVLDQIVGRWWDDEGNSYIQNMMRDSETGQIEDEFKKVLHSHTLPGFLQNNLRQSLSSFDNLDDWMLPLKNQVFNGQIATSHLNGESTVPLRQWTPQIQKKLDEDQAPGDAGLAISKWKQGVQHLKSFWQIACTLLAMYAKFAKLPLASFVIGLAFHIYPPRDQAVMLMKSVLGLGRHSLKNGDKTKCQSSTATLSGSLQRPLEGSLLNACQLSNLILYESVTSSYIPKVDLTSSLEDINTELFKLSVAIHAEVAANWGSLFPGALQKMYKIDAANVRELLVGPIGEEAMSKVIKDFNRLLIEGCPDDRRTSLDEYSGANSEGNHQRVNWLGIDDMAEFYKRIRDEKVPWLGERTMEKLSGSAALRRLCCEYQYALLQSPVKEVCHDQKQRALAKTAGRTQIAGEEMIEALFREHWQQELGHQKDVFLCRAKFVVKRSTKFAASEVDLPAAHKAAFEVAVEKYMLDKVDDLWRALQHSAKALETSLDFGLALGRIRFGQDGLPMGRVTYKLINGVVQPESAETMMKSFWEGQPEKPLTLRRLATNNSRMLEQESINRMYSRILSTDLQSDIAILVDKADADSYYPRSKETPVDDTKLEGGAIQEMALRIFKSFHVQAMLVLRPHLNTLYHNMYNEKSLIACLRADKELKALKGKVIEKQLLKLQSDIERLKGIQEQRRRALDGYKGRLSAS